MSTLWFEKVTQEIIMFPIFYHKLSLALRLGMNKIFLRLEHANSGQFSINMITFSMFSPCFLPKIDHKKRGWRQQHIHGMESLQAAQYSFLVTATLATQRHAFGALKGTSGHRCGKTLWHPRAFHGINGGGSTSVGLLEALEATLW